MEKITFKCETDIETYIIPTKNIITMKPIHSQDGEPYIKVEYYDDELCITYPQYRNILFRHNIFQEAFGVIV